MSDDNSSSTPTLDERLQAIEDKLDHVLEALNNRRSDSRSRQHIPKRKRGSSTSTSAQSDACDEDADNQTSDDSDGLSNRSKFIPCIFDMHH